MQAKDRFFGALAGVILTSTGLCLPLKAQVKVDPKLPVYKAPKEKLSGTLSSCGSDLATNQMTLWAEGFVKFHPALQVQFEGEAAATASAALTSGTVQFGPMMRPMDAAEVAHFKKKHGYEPTPLPACFQMLAVCVQKDNPITGLTLQQVDAIFSRTRKGGYEKPINTWGELGLKGEWEKKPIAVYIRNTAFASSRFFREVALFKGDFRANAQERASGSSVSDAVGSDKFAIGYNTLQCMTADVKGAPLAAEKESPHVPADEKHAHAGTYPLARPLLVYVNHKPDTPLDPLRREFIRYIYSQEGQKDVVRGGWVPINPAIAAKSLAKVGLLN